jgi:hypothetical protein
MAVADTRGCSLQFVNIDIRFEVNPGHVLLHCTGTYDLPSALEMYDAAYAMAAQEQLPAALIDARALNGDPPTTMDRFNMGLHVASNRAPGIRLAVVGEPGMVDPARLGETVAVNRGAAMRVFTDLDAARAWIDDPDAPPAGA